MTTEQKVIRAKVELLELAKQLENVAQACRVMSYIRDSFDRFKPFYETGRESAIQDLTGLKPLLRNRVAPELEDAVGALALAQPAWGQLRVANKLARQGQRISPEPAPPVRSGEPLRTIPKRPL